MKLEKNVLGSQVTEILRARILSGEYAPGYRLVERALAAEFGTSQGPIRDAIRDLEACHLVVTKPHSGTWVKGDCHLEIANALMVKGSLEALAVDESRDRLKYRLDELKDANLAMERAIATKDDTALALQEMQFHHLIVEAAENPVLLESWNNLPRPSACFYASLRELGRIDLGLGVREHQAMIESIESHQWQELSRLVRDHAFHFAWMLRAGGHVTKEG
jgi:DNA-binding GntR family transcriptional regulator